MSQYDVIYVDSQGSRDHVGRAHERSTGGGATRLCGRRRTPRGSDGAAGVQQNAQLRLRRPLLLSHRVKTPGGALGATLSFPSQGVPSAAPHTRGNLSPRPSWDSLAAVAELRLLTLVSFYRRSTLTDIRTTPRRGKIGLQTRIPVIVGVATVGLLGSAPAAATLAVVAPASAQADPGPRRSPATGEPRGLLRTGVERPPQAATPSVGPN